MPPLYGSIWGAAVCAVPLVFPMDALATRVLAFVSRNALIPGGARVLVAVSGGGDSVALWYLLAGLAQRGRFDVVGLAHLDHRLRGAASDADASFCEALATRSGLPSIVESMDVAALAQARHISVEHAGHWARHDFLDRAADRLGATHVALGHTLDDQAETYLLRLLRGAGAAGLSAMRPSLGRVARPLLSTRRCELREYLAARGLAFREDPSNSDERVSRNRVRHDLLPHLGRYAPRVVETLAREAEIARADDDWLDRAANELRATLVKSTERGIELDAPRLSALHPALARRVVRLVLADTSDRASGFDHVERVRALAAGSVTPVDLPGCRAERRGDWIQLVPRAGREPLSDEEVEPFDHQLDVPGEVALPEAGVALRAAWDQVDSPAGPQAAMVTDAAEARCALAVSVHVESRPLRVRNWRPGDWFRPAGLQGHRKKLQDLFVDRKVERRARRRVPVVLDARDRVIWVVGHGVGEEFRAPEAPTDMIMLTVRPLGDKL